MNRLNRVNRSWQPWELIPILARFWPSAFTVVKHRRRPLKIGIHHDLLRATAGVIPRAEIMSALRHYASNIGYLRACSAGAARVDLYANVAGCVSEREAADASARLTRIREILLARKLGEPAGGIAPFNALGLRDAKTAQLFPEAAAS
jgi:sRNA-binding protein